MKYLNKVLLVLVLFFISSVVSAKQINIYLFHSSDCMHCKAEIKFLDSLKEKYDIKVYKYEVMYDEENSKLMHEIKELMGEKSTYVPFTVIGTTTFTGFNETNEYQIENAIKEYQTSKYCDKVGVYMDITKDTGECEENKKTSSTMKLPILGEVDVKSFSLPIISVVIGLVDGFNPCAMWVLIFLLSILVGMKNRKKMWILGLTFIGTSALVYLLIMLAWLNIVASFTTIRWLQIIIAIVALIASFINIRSYFKARKEDDGCTVTNNESRKKIVSKVKSIAENSENKKKYGFILAILGIIALAISVNVIELACSAGLPLIFTQILAMNDVTSVSKLVYILIYILFFMMDYIIVFVIAMFTFKVTGISTKYTKYSHLIGGIIMLLIGLLMIIKPEWIMFNF